MEISLYLFLAKIGLIALLIAFFYHEDIDVQIIFIIVSFILFLALALLAFNLETTTYSSGWQTRAVTEYTYVLLSFMFVIISTIYGFVLIMERGRKTIEQSVEGLNYKTFDKPKGW